MDPFLQSTLLIVCDYCGVVMVTQLLLIGEDIGCLTQDHTSDQQCSHNLIVLGFLNTRQAPKVLYHELEHVKKLIKYFYYFMAK